jgi:hypothetical protein
MSEVDKLFKTDLMFEEYFQDKKKGGLKKMNEIRHEMADVLDYYHLGADLLTGSGGDVRTISGTGNLEQAILHRLRTRKGELKDLGHPNYGCEMYTLIGEPNNETTRGLLRLMVMDALRQEPRIKEIINVEVRPRRLKKNSDRPDVEGLSSVDIDVFVRPIGSNEVRQVSILFSLEGA